MSERNVVNIVSAAAQAAIGVIFVAWTAHADITMDAPIASSVTLSSPTETQPVPAEPFVFPLSGHKLKMVSGFGARKLPPNAAGVVKTERHEGVDWAVPPGTKILAARSGKVLFAGFSKMYASRSDKTDQSRMIIVLHQDGKSTRYVHLNTLRVRPGEQVLAGDVLSTTAESDEWTVPVLHFEIREPNGRAVNPMKFLTEPVAP